MESMKYEVGPYNLHIIKNKNFKTVDVKINFKRLCKKDEITKRVLLSELLLESSSLYKDRRNLEIKTEELYNLKYDSYNMISGKYNLLTFEATFLNEKYTENNMLMESLKFLIDLFLSPNVIDNKFNKEQFDICKKIVEDRILSIKEDTNLYANTRMKEELGEDIYSYRPQGYIEDLENINTSNLYEYYKSIINSDIVDIFIIGDIDYENTKNIVKDLLTLKTIKKPSENHILEYNKYRKKVKVVREKMDIEQSKLSIGCKLIGLTDFERKYVMGIYSYILGGGPDSKLFKNVREKNSLCYSISSNYSGVFNMLTISAGINKNDFKKTISLIKKQMKDIENGKFTDHDIKCAVMTYMNAFSEMEDSIKSILTNYISKEYLSLDDIEERKKNYLKVTKDMVMDVSLKVHMDTIFLLEDNYE